MKFYGMIKTSFSTNIDHDEVNTKYYSFLYHSLKQTIKNQL